MRVQEVDLFGARPDEPNQLNGWRAVGILSSDEKLKAENRYPMYIRISHGAMWLQRLHQGI